MANKWIAYKKGRCTLEQKRPVIGLCIVHDQEEASSGGSEWERRFSVSVWKHRSGTQSRHLMLVTNREKLGWWMSCDCDNGWSAPGVCTAESRLGREAAEAVLDMLHVQPWATSRQFTLLPSRLWRTAERRTAAGVAPMKEQHYFSLCVCFLFFS